MLIETYAIIAIGLLLFIAVTVAKLEKKNRAVKVHITLEVEGIYEHINCRQFDKRLWLPILPRDGDEVNQILHFVNKITVKSASINVNELPEIRCYVECAEPFRERMVDELIKNGWKETCNK